MLIYLRRLVSARDSKLTQLLFYIYIMYYSYVNIFAQAPLCARLEADATFSAAARRRVAPLPTLVRTRRAGNSAIIA